MDNHDEVPFRWTYRPDLGFSDVIPEVNWEPYKGIVVVFGNIEVYEHGYRFDWAVVDNQTNIPMHVLQEDESFQDILAVIVDELYKEAIKNESKL